MGVRTRAEGERRDAGAVILADAVLEVELDIAPGQGELHRLRLRHGHRRLDDLHDLDRLDAPKGARRLSQITASL
jgi:hypothetical protein